MTRFAVVAHAHPALRLGGGEVTAYREYLELRRQGREAIFIGMTDDPVAHATLFRSGQSVVKHGSTDFIVRSRPFDNFGYFFEDLRDEDRLVALLASFEVDVFHFHHFWGIGAGTIRRLQRERRDAIFLLTLHEFQAICAADGQMVKRGSLALCSEASPIACAMCCTDHTPFDFVVRKRKLTALLNGFDRLLAPSAFLRTRFLEWGLAPDHVTLLENGVAWDTAPSLSGALPDEVRAMRFAYFGQATATKGLNVLVEAARRLFEAHGAAIHVDVYGVSRETFQRYFPELSVPPNVAFCGRYEPAAAVGLMRRYGWIVIPSIWWENSPVVIQEARAAGVPMVASRIGGVLEKTERWSVHFDPGDPVDLARVMKAVAGDATLMRSLSEQITPPLGIDAFVRALSSLVAELKAGRDATDRGRSLTSPTTGEGPASAGPRGRDRRRTLFAARLPWRDEKVPPG